MSNIKQFKHVASGVIHDYVDGHTLEGVEVTMLFAKGCWHTVASSEIDELIKYGIIELITCELLIEKEEV